MTITSSANLIVALLQGFLFDLAQIAFAEMIAGFSFGLNADNFSLK
jgi:hypothetical protein